MELGVGFAELVGASVEPASLAFDGTASPPRDGTASSPVEGTPSEASTPPDKAVVPPREAELGRGRRTSYHLTNFVSYDIFSSAHGGFLASITARVEPRSYRQALRDPSWYDPMKAEINALENNGIWSLVELPKDKKDLGNRWVYKIKYKSDGSVERLKARLVVFGNHQTEGIDYSDIFASVAKMSIVRAFLVVAAVRG
ncbi:transmembrane signal receptor [Lithospermum erythrorhizon]|uniref:Transmembrane signal receptor n=1 Tax=Lithospermum erythrorhizon TaxID=34254 RepID=A0AAV3R959_LITER